MPISQTHKATLMNLAASEARYDLHCHSTASDGMLPPAEVVARARRAWRQPEGWTALYRESVDAPYQLALEHDNTVNADGIHAEARAAHETHSINKALDAIWRVVADANRYFASEEPWVKRKTDPERMATVLYVTAEVLRIVAILSFILLVIVFLTSSSTGAASSCKRWASSRVYPPGLFTSL